jgi:histidinol dehydrogenase
LIQIEAQLKDLPRQDIAVQAIKNSYAVLVDTLEQGMEFSNVYAPEHLIISSDRFEQLIPLISNAGSVFLGNLTPESVGDYASGTNHTLPTSGFAKAYSGVSMDSFLKKDHLSAHHRTRFNQYRAYCRGPGTSRRLTGTQECNHYSFKIIRWISITYNGKTSKIYAPTLLPGTNIKDKPAFS